MARMRPDPKPPALSAEERTAARKAGRRRSKKRDGSRFCVRPRCIRHWAKWWRCHTHFIEWLDTAWSARIRTGRCEVRALHEAYGLECKGRIVACHLVGRFYGWTKWDLRNGISGCDAVNDWAERHVIEWEAISRAIQPLYDALRAQAMNPAPLDYDVWVHHLGLGVGPGPVVPTPTVTGLPSAVAPLRLSQSPGASG